MNGSRALLFSASCLLGIVPALGVPALDAPPMGCFERVYSPRHMAEHPAQNVRRIILHIENSSYSRPEIDFGLHVWVRGKPQVWRAGGSCEAADGWWHCRPDTDGASLLIIRAVSAGVRTENPGRLKIYDEKTGPELNDRLVGGPADRTFVLKSAPARICRDKES